MATISSVMDLGLLRTFLAVYRAGSLSAAAPRLGLSQPAVTAQLRTLETTLGRPLFERRARGVVPTGAADELARQVADHLDALDRVGLAETASVRLGGPADFLAERVLPALAGLVRDGLRLRVTLGMAEPLLAGLLAGRLDLVVSTIRPRDRAIGWTALTDEEFALVAAPGTPADAPLISYAEDLPLIRRYWRSAFGSAPSGTAAVVVPDLRAVLAATVAGAGVSVLPTYLCQAHLAAGTLVALHEPETRPINTFYLAVPAGRADSAVQRVADLLKNQLGNA